MLKRFLIVTTGLFVMACSVAEKQSVSPEKEQAVKQAGEESAMKLLKTLRVELMQAMQSGGPDQAVEVCSKKAMTLTKQIEDETGYKIKRTTFKYRNPANKPDKYEEEAIRYFEETLKKEDKLPTFYIQVVKEDGVTTYRYYKPLKVEGVCLTCHGDKSMMDTKLVSKIDRLYPQDRAHGYKEGDFRGVVRVSIPADKVR